MNTETNREPRPFLKWVGGKTQLLSELEARLPSDFAETVRVYAEPFVGGGALLFRILSRSNRLERIIANDSNPDLANAWRAVRDAPDDLVKALMHFQTAYRELSDDSVRKSFFLGVRCAYNAGRLNSTVADVGRALNSFF